MVKFVNIKSFALVLSLFLLAGCTVVSVPKYIKDENPYKRTLYADYQSSEKAVREALEEFGWVISSVGDPSDFELGGSKSPDAKELLVFTDIRQTSLFLGTRYARLNVILRAATDKSTDAEIRYLTINSLPFKSFYKYKQDAAVDRLYRHIEELLKK